MSETEIPEPDRIEGAPHPRHVPLLYGQPAAERDFLAAHGSGRMHHGWLITGPRGVGKATLAWKIARFLLSEPTRDGGMFGDAPPADTLVTPADTPLARRMTALAEPRLMLVRRPWDSKASPPRLKRDITVDEIRKLNGFFNLSATDGGHRVVIIDAADEMNPNAANALLKILEEPPANSTLLLISHRPMRLLPTIRSRCRVLKCQNLGPEDLALALAAAGFDDISARPEHLATLAAGSVGEAVRILTEQGLEHYQTLLALIADSPQMDRIRATQLAERCSGAAGQARYDLVLRLIEFLLHRLALKGASNRPLAEAADDEAIILGRFSKDAGAARDWATLAETLAKRSQHARAVNLDPAAVILDMLLKINQMAGQRRAA
ncbi:MAG: DNA polymerase III subunit delta' [Rhodobacteraceae bacterium]|nr:DNA polymerase III subunit delta' [Paracoccaceae bacterium]